MHPLFDTAPGSTDVFSAGPGSRRSAHAWRRTVSRRLVLQTAAGAAGMAVAGTLWAPGRGHAARMNAAMPKPIPGGIELGDGRVIHIHDNEWGQEPSTITDFRGFVGVSQTQGKGAVTKGNEAQGMRAATATGDRLNYIANMRFMQGRYVGEDGAEHDGTAAFI